LIFYLFERKYNYYSATVYLQNSEGGGGGVTDQKQNDKKAFDKKNSLSQNTRA